MCSFIYLKLYYTRCALFDAFTVWNTADMDSYANWLRYARGEQQLHHGTKSLFHNGMLTLKV